MMALLQDVLVFALSYIGLACLCLAMDRHYADLHGRGAEPSPRLRRRMQWGGWLALATGLAWSMHVAGFAHGLLSWTGSLTGCALLLVVLLAYAPRYTLRLAQGAAVAGACALLLAVM